MEQFGFICENGGERIDRFLSEMMPDMSRSAIASVIENGGCTVCGRAAKKNLRLCDGDEVIITLPDPVVTDILPEEIPLDIVYEDKELLVVNKLKGMVVHPSAGHYSGTLVNALMYHCKDSLSGINGKIRPGIVHRIDKDTSGLLVVAKNDLSHNILAAQIKEHSFTREYAAVVKGCISDDGTVNAPIGRHPVERKKMCVTEKNSKEAVTHYYVEERYLKNTLLRLRLETGRTHQIRVHMAYIGHPVAGDAVYSDGTPSWLSGQCLHAKKIGFIHPNGEYMEFDSALPDYFTKMLKRLEAERIK